MSEPDRFDAQARELFRSLVMDEARAVPMIAAALHAAESSALERAAQECRSMAADPRPQAAHEALLSASDRIRAQIPPAAAPAACTCQRCDPEMPGLMWSTGLERHVPCTDSSHAAPAAETGKAPGAEALQVQMERDIHFARERAEKAEARIAELERALLDFLCSHGPPPDCAGKGECVCDTAWPLFGLPHGAVDLARAKLAARAAPPEGEGT
ncbi:MAG TPA: hypothetical protein VGI97_00545 [Gemmatimonadaceae bacterium]|jgi:hypothetical protein